MVKATEGGSLSPRSQDGEIVGKGEGWELDRPRPEVAGRRSGVPHSEAGGQGRGG